MRLITRILPLSISLVAIHADLASAQASGSARQSRTQAILASFNKHKHVVKEKFGVRVEKYKEIRSEPVVRANPATYSGTYIADFGFTLRLQVDANGRVEGSGEDPITDDARVMRRFTLRNGRIDGALLTATKAYPSGASQSFEGVFINMTSFESPTDKGVTVFGLGVLGTPLYVAGVTVDKLFYELKR